MTTNHQPHEQDLRHTGKAGNHLCAFAFQGEHKGKRFVKPLNGLWLPAGAASEKEMRGADLWARLFGGVMGGV